MNSWSGESGSRVWRRCCLLLSYLLITRNSFRIETYTGAHVLCVIIELMRGSLYKFPRCNNAGGVVPMGSYREVS